MLFRVQKHLKGSASTDYSNRLKLRRVSAKDAVISLVSAAVPQFSLTPKLNAVIKKHTTRSSKYGENTMSILRRTLVEVWATTKLVDGWAARRE